MKKELYKIPNMMVGHYHPEINAIIDTWESLHASLEEWKATVFEIGIVDFAPKNGVRTWIIDTSKASGVFGQDVQEFRQNVAGPKLEQNGVKYMFVVTSQEALGALSSGRTARIYKSGSKMQSFQVKSIQEAMDILKEAGEI